VQVVADWSLALIFLLVMVNLAIGVFPAWHPGWGALLTWGVALGASVLFFGSVLAHELSHALVGRRFGIPVRRITLFIFGGMAHMEREPPSPKSELLMAAAGPIASLAIGFVATLLGGWALTDELAMFGDPMLAVAYAGPLTTLLIWLGPVNILLGLFNLVPGFPLDGGRVLRAVLWAATRNLEKATRWASWGGQAVAWILIALGLTGLLSGGLLQGLWFMLIGWFLLNVARASYLQTVVHESLRGTRVADLMRRRVVTVSPALPVSVLVSDFLMAVDQQCFPVVDDERFAGLVCIDDVRRVPRDAWVETTVAQIMTPVSAIEPLPADAPATEALRKLELSERDIDQVPVVERDGSLLGLVRRQDILRWLRLHAPGEPLPA
jgi:Zn-dependent protease